MLMALVISLAGVVTASNAYDYERISSTGECNSTEKRLDPPDGSADGHAEGGSLEDCAAACADDADGCCYFSYRLRVTVHECYAEYPSEPYSVFAAIYATVDNSYCGEGLDSEFYSTEKHEFYRLIPRPTPKPPQFFSVPACEAVTVDCGAACELSGTYECDSDYNGTHWWVKDGLKHDTPNGAYPEQFQIWWKDNNWRLGYTNNHWYLNDDPDDWQTSKWVPQKCGLPLTISLAPPSSQTVSSTSTASSTSSSAFLPDGAPLVLSIAGIVLIVFLVGSLFLKRPHWYAKLIETPSSILGGAPRMAITAPPAFDVYGRA